MKTKTYTEFYIQGDNGMFKTTGKNEFTISHSARPTKWTKRATAEKHISVALIFDPSLVIVDNSCEC